MIAAEAGSPRKMSEQPHPFAGRSAVLVTMHGKEKAVAPAFGQVLGMNLVVTKGVNTDALGTFSGETLRRGSMLETAVAKAWLGINATGLQLAIASEGSFGPHALIPFLPSGIETLVFVDADQGWVIHEAMAVEQTNFAHLVAVPGTPINTFLTQVGFPEHGLIVRPNAGDSFASLAKGLVDRGDLDDAVATAAASSADGRARIETDMRAHLNPTRMDMLARLAMRLALRLAAHCPGCSAPGWGRIDVALGLPCELCRMPTQVIAAEVLGCAACGIRELQPRRDGMVHARPAQCVYCNP
ncbi:MAG: hypothetical protein LH632_20405 [Rhodoferax sp.]|nr:hypothetical protein [Rhodoferax sp.]